MLYRKIGSSGDKASIIGLGGEHMDGAPYTQVEEIIHAALDRDINYIDCFMPKKEVRENIAKALGNRRKDVNIQGAIGSTEANLQYDISRNLPTTKKYFEEMLQIFGGYIDVGMLFMMDSEKDFQDVFDGGIADYVQKLKKNGDIRHIGFSSHNPVIAKKVLETNISDVMMFSINLAFDLLPNDLDLLEVMFEDGRLRSEIGTINQSRMELYTLAEQKGVGISVMKAYGGGKLISKDQTPFSKPMSTSQCIHYVLSRPAVFSSIIGCKTVAELDAAVSYINTSEIDKDYTPFLEEAQNGLVASCVYCNHCQPCPVNIDIAAVNKYLDMAKLDERNIPPSLFTHYKGLERKASDCIACGSCEDRCPFGVAIRKNMLHSAKLFENR